MTAPDGRTPVEVTTRHVTTTADLADAWVFVMERVDLVGPDPQVSITPEWTGDARRFMVEVSGMVEETS